MSFEVTSKTRDDIRTVAATNGWTRTASDYGDDFHRIVELPADNKLAKLAHHMGFLLREKVSVSYSSAGSAIAGFRMDPTHQAALDGRFVDCVDLGAPRKANVIAALSREPFSG